MKIKKLLIGLLVLSGIIINWSAPAYGADLGVGPKYGAFASGESNLTFARGVVTSINILSLEKDTTGAVKFKLVEEIAYLEYQNGEIENQMVSVMSYGMVPVYGAFWVGMGTGFYNFIVTGGEDVKATCFGLKGTIDWKSYRLAATAEALQLAGADNYFLGFDLTRGF